MYPTDMKIDEDTMNVFLGSEGDMETIGGRENLEQSVAIIVRNATQQFVGDRITGPNVGMLEERIRQALNADPQVAEIINVEIDEYDRRDDSVHVTATTIENEDFTFGVTA